MCFIKGFPALCRQGFIIFHNGVTNGNLYNDIEFTAYADATQIARCHSDNHSGIGLVY